MDIITILRQDYAKFPIDQNYQIYAEDVYFQDPLTRFHGLDRYRKMVGFIETWFKDPQLESSEIDRVDRRSEMLLNDQELIISHIDYWDCKPTFRTSIQNILYFISTPRYFP
jgi:hypothetical protein